MAAAHIHRKAHRHTNSSLSSRDTSGPGMPGPFSYDATENSPLLPGSRTRRWSIPHGGVAVYCHDHRVWVRWPAESYHVAYSTLASNYVNVLLVFVPLGILSGALEWPPTATFILNFFAIIPLASLLSFATEELAAVMGQTLGGLLNATFGNAVELIVSIIALKNNEIRIVQASMLGSILSNMLLVLGCCFLVGGLTRSEQTFNTTMASTMSSLMCVSAASLIIPAALNQVTSNSAESKTGILILSRWTAIVLLVVYVMYLVFQLKTHSYLFEESSEQENDGTEEQRVLTPVAAGIVLLLITVAVAVCAEYLVDSIDSIVTTFGLSKTFIGLILLPIVGNAAEHVTAVVVAYKSKMDLAIGVAIGSSLQIALFVTPFLVILGWVMDRDMTLHFDPFETITFFLSMLVVTLLIMDGKSNYLEGGLCLGMYIIIALAFYVYPEGSSPAAKPMDSTLSGALTT